MSSLVCRTNQSGRSASQACSSGEVHARMTVRAGLSHQCRCQVVVLLSLIVLTIPAGRAFGQPVSPVEPAERSADSERIQKLISQLASPRRSERVSAEAALAELGPAALPEISRARERVSPQLKERLRALETRLEIELARQTFAASRVTIKRAVSFRTAIEAIADQTENPLQTGVEPDSIRSEALTGPFQNQTFWSVISRLENEYSISTIACIEGVESPLVTSGRRPPLAESSMDAFRTTVISLSRRQLFGNADYDRLRVGLMVQTEPRLRTLFVRFRPSSCVARTPDGADFERLLSTDTVIELPATDAQHSFPVTLDLLIPKDSVTRSFQLEGSFEIELAARRVPFEFPLARLDQPARERAGGVQLECRRLPLFSGKIPGGNENIGIQIRIAYDRGGPAFESHRTWLYHNAVGLLNREGTMVRPKLPFEVRQREDGAAQIQYMFEPQSAEIDTLRFVYEAPTLIARKKVPFTFSNLEIPGHQSGDDKK